jgi:subtilisin family serine protease
VPAAPLDDDHLWLGGRRLLPEQWNVTWGLDSIDQSAFPLDSTYKFERNGALTPHPRGSAAPPPRPRRSASPPPPPRSNPAGAAARPATQATDSLPCTRNGMLAGSGVHVYVLDTGVRTSHSEFRSQEGASRTGAGFDAVTAGGTAQDCHSHGTHVAAIAGGE